MKQFVAILACAALTSGVFTACNNSTESPKASTDSTQATPPPAVAIDTCSAAHDFPDAAISLGSMTATPVGTDSANVSFTFNTKNYTLQAQTPDAASRGCAVAEKGQHIHFIMDNQAYKALYEPKNSITLANNTEHYLLAFLSRSYHESIKTKEAAVLLHFKIDGKGKLTRLDNPKEPMLFYSRPKGDYIGADTTNILLDFYVWNASLSDTGYKVTAEVNNETLPSQHATATLAAWRPYMITNLGCGKSTVKLTLVGKDGQAVAGPQSTVSRTFNLAAQAPATK